MEIYLVGGAVRDALLGLPVTDRDWVVVGADAQTLQKMGYRSVGKDFPVFLHPVSHEEYALARQERKIGKGYAGFVFSATPNITLEDDLLRRDLTINAMAQDSSGSLIDPYGGKKDLENKILRHISPAFAEDPVRILRTARFAARFRFRVADETMNLMREMVANGEAQALIAERVWREFSKGLMESHPRIMVEVLQKCGALSAILPEINHFSFNQTIDFYDKNLEHALSALQRAADAQCTLPERYAAFLLGLIAQHTGDHVAVLEHIRAINRRLHAPKICAEMALLAARYGMDLMHITKHSAEKIIHIFNGLDSFRRPERFQSMLNICRAQMPNNDDNTQYFDTRWQQFFDAARAVNAKQIAQNTPTHAIAHAIDEARRTAIQQIINAG